MMTPLCRTILVVALLAAFDRPARSQEEAGPANGDLCSQSGVVLPLTAADPKNWDTWVSTTDLKDTYCSDVAVVELRTRAKKNSQGELAITFKATTYTRPGHDKKATITIDVLADDRVVKSATIEGIDAEEKKNGRGTGYLVVPVDWIAGSSSARFRVFLTAVED